MILEQCKGVHRVDLGESFQTHIYLQNFVSIQPRTSPVKFAASRDSPRHSPSPRTHRRRARTPRPSPATATRHRRSPPRMPRNGPADSPSHHSVESKSRRELSKAYLLAKFRFDTAENEPCKVCRTSTPRVARRTAGRAPARCAGTGDVSHNAPEMFLSASTHRRCVPQMDPKMMKLLILFFERLLSISETPGKRSHCC